MGRQFGKWHPTCPVCNGVYTLTNFMRRKSQVWKDGLPAGWRSTDTHVMACKRKHESGEVRDG